MNLVIDCGNTRIKTATFSGADLVKKFSFQSRDELKLFLDSNQFVSSIISSVGIPAEEISRFVKAEKKFVLKHVLPLPIKILYQTPETLGVDRIAAVCGALSIFPSDDALVIDAGTCVTYDFVDRNKNYYGGAISPGINMRFEAMHTFTKRLPLVEAAPEKLIGDSTESSMRSGVMNGILGEVEGFINNYRIKYPDLRVVLCGGDTQFFENNLKPTIFAAPDLVLIGLNRILNHNAAL
ncbi:MAG: type III pantothenate kinase [Bacteroidetes bacterium]|nr:type III pantothenate kinase [Bacteroidota bacterium]MBI3483053.1 type III pantothenate kinase [Bacteroidota bacterium]